MPLPVTLTAQSWLGKHAHRQQASLTVGSAAQSEELTVRFSYEVPIEVSLAMLL